MMFDKKRCDERKLSIPEETKTKPEGLNLVGTWKQGRDKESCPGKLGSSACCDSAASEVNRWDSELTAVTVREEVGSEWEISRI
ncbi:hypothetical protein VNO77_38845 [Canavalia gladiata]|uniref:Uncharacterized protein n=1 Tax=Canavalia gladiata TaxID=3824 RepID=A0AAN9PVA5_CANGL